jgi:hypothetical protein
MPRYKAPTIAERGGLEAYMTEQGYDYKLFRSLRNSIGDRYGAIAEALSKKANLMLDRSAIKKKPLRPQRVKHWCRVDAQEQEDKKHGRS